MTARNIRAIIDGKDLVSAPAGMLVSDAARVMKQRRIGAIIVLDGDKLAGIFTERDALFRVVAEGRDPNATSVADVMTRNPVTIHPDRPFESALEIMHNGRFRHVPVVEGGRPIGMVSSRDALGAELEQFMYTVIVEEQQRDILA